MSSITPATSLLLTRNLNANNQSAMNTLERLATGSAINRTSENPAGLIASENFASRLNVIQTQITTTERNISVLNTQDANLGVTLENISDLDSLVLQSANAGGLTGSEMDAIQTQVTGILTGIDRIASTTGIDITSQVTTEMVIGTDEATGDPITETVSLADLSRVLETDPEAAQRLVDGAREALVTAQAQVGIEARAAESERRVLEEEQINLARAYSQTRDTDYARESSNMIRSQILTQASIYTILAQRQSDGAILGLLSDITA